MGNEIEKSQAEVQRLRDDGLAALREAERLEATKLEADSYEAVEQINREIAKQQWLANKAATQLPPAEARLAAAKAKAQKEAIARHQAERRRLWARFKPALLELARLQAEGVAADQAACAELGEHVARAHLPPVVYGGFLYPDLVATYVAHNDAIFAAPAPKAPPQPQVKPATPRATVAPKQAPPRRDVMTAPPRPDDPPPGPNEVQVRVVIAGYPDATGGHSQRGRLINLAPDAAEIAVKNGKVEFVTPTPAAPAPPANDTTGPEITQ
jgi:hypothetical protein